MQLDDFAVRQFPGVDDLGVSGSARTLRVCIVTEEIIGPVRNGGIASTYYHLAKGLAAHGHDVHVLFLKGPVVQDETPEHWVRHFAEFGVTLHYLDVPSDPMWGAAIKWQARFAAAYRWLRDTAPFDVVHTSEWRGGTIYALMAKRLGLAFRDTLFLVKTSSPHIWNRHYQMQPIQQRDLLTAAYAEQKCVELADAVIGGSAHLITFMGEIGYAVPQANVFVQPNIVDFSKVPVSDARPPRAPGDRIHTKELIFFGRLEGRKGVELMCNALDILCARGVLPERVAFMGKWGAPLATQGGMKVEEYLDAKAAAWPFPVEYITDKNQPAALSHMCARDMVAVMPSLIENSTMAVYETLEKNIPFVATAVGGTPELVAEEDHAACLVAPKSTALADRLEDILQNGHVIAHPAFSNDANLDIWYGFHAHLAEEIAAHGAREAITRITAAHDRAGAQVRSLAYAATVTRADNLAQWRDAMLAARDKDAHETDDESGPDHIVLGYSEEALRAPLAQTADALGAAGYRVTLREEIGLSAGDLLGDVAACARDDADALILAQGLSAWPEAGFAAAARTALTLRPDALFTTFFTDGDGLMGLPLGGDVATQFFTGSAYGPELIALTTARMEALGPIEPYDVRHGLLHEYVTRAVMDGADDLLVFPEPLIAWPDALNEAREVSEDTVYAYLKAKPLIDRGRLAERKIILSALHMAGGSTAGGISQTQLFDGGRDAEAPLWLTPADWDRADATLALKRALVVALDEDAHCLMLYARGAGDRKLMVGEVAQKIEEISREPLSGGEEGEVMTVARFEIPPTWEAGASVPVSWALYDGETKLKNQFFRILKLTPLCYAISARNPILNAEGLARVLDGQRRIEALLSGVSAPVERPVETPSEAGAGPQDAREDPTPEPISEPGLARLGRAGQGTGQETGQGGEKTDETLWLTPSDWERSDATQAQRRDLVVALDEAESCLLLYARGAGQRVLTVAGAPQPVTELERIPMADEDEESFITLARFDIPADWPAGRSYPISWALQASAGGAKSQFLRISKLSERAYALGAGAGGHVILNRRGMEAVIARQRAMEARLGGASEEGSGLHAPSEAGLMEGRTDAEDALWLIPAEWDRAAIDQARHRSLTVALDEAESCLLLYARGAGARALMVAGGAQEITELSREAGPSGGADDILTLARFEIPGDWQAGRSYPIHWTREGGDGTYFNQFLRVTKLAERSYAVAAPNVILSAAGLEALMTQHRMDAARFIPNDPAEAGLPAQDPETVADLLALAESTGRGALAKKLQRQLSHALIAHRAGDAPEPGHPEIKSFLNPPQTGAWSLGSESGDDGGDDGGDEPADALRGWAWDKRDRARSLAIALVLEGEGREADRPVFMTRADTHMPGLRRRTPGLEHHGYRIPLAGLALPASGRLTLVIWETRKPVRGGALVIRDGKLYPDMSVSAPTRISKAG